MKTKKLRLGIIGSGFISYFQAKALKQMREFDVTGVCSKDPESAQKFAHFCAENGLGETQTYATVSELVKNSDVVSLNVPNFSRIEVMEEIVKTVKAGYPLRGVTCEKPLGRTYAEAKRMVALAKEINVPTSYFENQIHMNSIEVQKKQLSVIEKKMGPLTLARSAEEHGGPHSPWFWNPTLQGGGVLSDMGCHSIAMGWYTLNPYGKPVDFLKPQSIQCDLALLKWGQPQYAQQLKDKMGIDFLKAPAEDFATGMITFKNPETGQIVKSQFTDSWMFEKQGLRLFMDGTGPGYAFEINTLISPLSIFIGDEAAVAIQDQEAALEKSTASRGLLAVQSNEADLYGYTDENRDAAQSFLAGKDAKLNFEYGLEIVKLTMAAYLSAERKQTIDLTDPQILKELETFTPMIFAGRGREFFNI